MQGSLQKAIFIFKDIKDNQNQHAQWLETLDNRHRLTLDYGTALLSSGDEQEAYNALKEYFDHPDKYRLSVDNPFIKNTTVINSIDKDQLIDIYKNANSRGEYLTLHLTIFPEEEATNTSFGTYIPHLPANIFTDKNSDDLVCPKCRNLATPLGLVLIGGVGAGIVLDRLFLNHNQPVRGVDQAVQVDPPIQAEPPVEGADQAVQVDPPVQLEQADLPTKADPPTNTDSPKSGPESHSFKPHHPDDDNNDLAPPSPKHRPDDDQSRTRMRLRHVTPSYNSGHAAEEIAAARQVHPPGYENLLRPIAEIPLELQTPQHNQARILANWDRMARMLLQRQIDAVGPFGGSRGVY